MPCTGARLGLIILVIVVSLIGWLIRILLRAVLVRLVLLLLEMWSGSNGLWCRILELL